MKARPFLLLGTSAILGVVAIALLRALSHPAAAPATVKIVTAAAPMRFGDQLTANRLQLADYQPDSVPPGAFRDLAELTTGDARYVIQSIEQGEPVLGPKITGKGGKASLSSVIDQGKRAVTIRVDDVFGVGGFVTPSDHVDVMLTHGADPQKPNDNPQTEILLQNVKVLGIDQEASERKEKAAVAKAVTLEVTPEEAQKLALGRMVGTLSLSLRNFVNPNAVDSHAVSVADLSPAKAKPTPIERAKASARRTIAVIRGTEPTNYELWQDGAVAKPDTKKPNG